MNQNLSVESPANVRLQRGAARQVEVGFRPLLLLVTIIALLNSSVEIELLEHLDALSNYMTWREVALDAGVALLVVTGLGVIWWICVLLAFKMAKVIPSVARSRISLAWFLGVALPSAYFAIGLCSAVLRASHLHPRFSTWVVLAVGFTVVCIAGLFLVSAPTLQNFCSTRLAPVGWFHLVLMFVVVIGLWADGVRLFHDYARAPRLVVTSGLPDIYLLTFDALRADDTSVYGYDRPTTPNLQRFAQESFTFDYFFANSNFTTPTTTSIETGQLPWSHRVFHGGGFLHGRDPAHNLAALLRERGYYTAMVTANFLAGPFRHRTVDSYDAVEYVAPQGFSGWWSRYTNLIGANTQFTLTVPLLQIVAGIRFYADALLYPGHYLAPPEAVFDGARNILERPDIKQPRFVWAHALAPHDPYLPPAPYLKRFLTTNKLTSSFEFLGMRPEAPPPGVSAAELRARYDEMVLDADHSVGDFLDWLDRTGRLNNAVVIISADHGESFEHNWFLHTGPYLYNGLIRVPFLIHLPGQQRGTHVDAAAQQADLLPTILDIIGVPAPSWTDGTSLMPLLKGKPLSPRYVYSMNLENNRAFDPITRGTVAVVDDQFKYVDYLDRHQEALFRYKADPTDEHNLIGTEPAVSQRMHEVLLEKLKEVNQRFTPKQ